MEGPSLGEGETIQRRLLQLTREMGIHRQFPLLVEIVVAAVLMHVLALRGTAGSAV